MPTRPPTHKPTPFVRPQPARQKTAARGYDSRWRAARLAFLRDHPLCENCKGAGDIKGATVVDHRIPHRGDPALFWDMGNWQPLCLRCHNKKTACEDGGFGRPVK
jgi:5-methylcytosine-specific restriction enzyme A